MTQDPTREIGAVRIDHLVVLAPDLAAGVAWCEATLGVSPGPGGEHPLMGTHNRLMRIAGPTHLRAYLEIIAINPAQPAPNPPRAARWFDMDDLALMASVRTHGPRLAHFVGSVPRLDAATAALQALGIERGAVLPASRMTPRGLLQWRITVREDGQRLFDGVLPTLIEWGEVHPADGMAESGVQLLSLSASHPQSAVLNEAFNAIGLDNVAVTPGAADLQASLQTPRGVVTLHSRLIP